MKPLALHRRHPGPETERKWEDEEGCRGGGEGREGEEKGGEGHVYSHIRLQVRVGHPSFPPDPSGSGPLHFVGSPINSKTENQNKMAVASFTPISLPGSSEGSWNSCPPVPSYPLWSMAARAAWQPFLLLQPCVWISSRELPFSTLGPGA